jgi:hypothetical protein
MCLVRADRLDYLSCLGLALTLSLYSLFLLGCLEFGNGVKQLDHTLGGDYLQFPFVIFVLGGRDVSAHESDLLLKDALLAEFGIETLLL